MTTDIRELLQQAQYPTRELDFEIARFLKYQDYHNHKPYQEMTLLEKIDTLQHLPEFTSDYNFSIRYIEKQEFDWVMGNVNGMLGGTPFAFCGCPEPESSYSATPLLSLWLSYIRTQFGDERKEKESETTDHGSL